MNQYNIQSKVFSNDAFIDRTVDKYPKLVQDKIKDNIFKYNFKIQFIEPVWVLKQEGGGITGDYRTKAVYLDTTPFGVLSVSKDKKTQASRIHVWSDGCCDGDNCFLINVPNGLFRQIHDDEEGTS